MVSPAARLLPVAYLPQHVWEVGGATFAVVALVMGVGMLARGYIPGHDEASPQTARRAGLLATAAGALVLVGVFTLNAEPPGSGRGPDHWGGVAGVIGLVVWLGGLVAVTAPTLRGIFKRRTRKQASEDV